MELARRVHSTQSQISQFEAGRVSSVSEDVALKMIELLEIDLDVSHNESCELEAFGICTNAQCPGTIYYLAGEDILVRPTLWRVRTPLGATLKCRFCGDPVVTNCAVCNEFIQTGVFCGSCGSPHVDAPPELVSLPFNIRQERVDLENRRHSEFSRLPAFDDLPLLQ